jgi:AcrR family transcriptional regulator
LYGVVKVSAAPRPRRRLPSAQRRVVLLEAASEVVGEVGGRQALLADVARRAGVTKSLLYRHFASKEDLLAALVDHHAERALARVAAIAATGSLEADLRAGIRAVVDYAAEQPGAWRILFVERYEDLAPRAAQAALVSGARSMVAARLEREVGASQSPELVAQLLRSALDGAIAWWHEHPEVSADELADTTHALLWGGLAGLRHL